MIEGKWKSVEPGPAQRHSFTLTGEALTAAKITTAEELMGALKAVESHGRTMMVGLSPRSCGLLITLLDRFLVEDMADEAARLNARMRAEALRAKRNETQRDASDDLKRAPEPSIDPLQPEPQVGIEPTTARSGIGEL